MTPPIVFCCGMVRSGSTVLYQIASGILELRGIGRRCGYYEPPAHRPVLLSSGTSVYKVPWLCEFEREQIRRGAVAFYSFRNLEQALDSAFRAFNVPAGDRWFWRALVHGHSTQMEILFRECTPGVCFFDFEQIRDNLRGVIETISRILPGRALDRIELDALAADLSLENQRKRTKIQPYDPHTLIFPQHFD